MSATNAAYSRCTTCGSFYFHETPVPRTCKNCVENLKVLVNLREGMDEWFVKVIEYAVQKAVDKIPRFYPGGNE